jgi:hypothetical protein
VALKIKPTTVHKISGTWGPFDNKVIAHNFAAQNGLIQREDDGEFYEIFSIQDPITRYVHQAIPEILNLSGDAFKVIYHFIKEGQITPESTVDKVIMYLRGKRLWQSSDELNNIRKIYPHLGAYQIGELIQALNEPEPREVKNGTGEVDQ